MKKMISLFAGLAMLLGSASVLPVCAEEPVKNFDYYWNLDDYSVYKEYVETYGIYDVLPTLPAECDLPWYVDARYYFTDGSNGNSTPMPFDIEMADRDNSLHEVEELLKTPSFFGFPDEWSMKNKQGENDTVLCLKTGAHGHIILGFDFEKLSINDVTEDCPVLRSTVDLYRLRLTLEHSDFAKEYVRHADESNYYYIGMITPMGDDFFIYGDTNEDGVTNSSDAAAILIEAARTGAGNPGSFTELQNTAADVNKDGTANASDATIVLRYAAAVGSGDRYAKIGDFVH